MGSYIFTLLVGMAAGATFWNYKTEIYNKLTGRPSGG